MLCISMHLHIVYMVPYYGLLGHHSLQTALEVKSDLGFEISDLNQVTCHPGSIRSHVVTRVNLVTSGQLWLPTVHQVTCAQVLSP